MIDREPRPTDARDIEERYRLLVEQSPAIVYIWGTCDGLETTSDIYVSPQIERILGFPPEEWEADPRLWIDRLHTEDRDDVVGETTRAVAAAESFTMEYRMLAKDGRVVWLHDEASILSRDEQGGVVYQGVQVDITAQKEAESEHRKSLDLLGIIDKQRRQLLARVVASQEEVRRRLADDLHDDTMQGLFTLQVTLTHLARDHPELVQEGLLPRLQRDLSESIVRLRLLAFELHPRILDTEGLLAALRAQFEGSSGRAVPEYELESRLEKDPPKETLATLYRIGREALANVHKHSGSTRVTVSIQERDDGLLMRIEDNGAGFDTAILEDTSRDHFGISSMREHAEVAGGWCRIESTLGGGTRVEYWLPGSWVGTEQFLRSDPDLDSSADAEAKAVGGSSSGSAMEKRRDLSPREAQVAHLLVLGHTNAEIGAILFLSIRTVEHHRASVFGKLGVHSRAGLVRWVRDHPLRGSADDL